MFYQIMFESTKNTSTLECVQAFVPISWMNVRQIDKLIV